MSALTPQERAAIEAVIARDEAHYAAKLAMSKIPEGEPRQRVHAIAYKALALRWDRRCDPRDIIDEIAAGAPGDDG